MIPMASGVIQKALWVQGMFNLGLHLDGFRPITAVTIGLGGVVYGTTLNGGTLGCGTVFSLTPPAAQGDSWTEAVIYNLTQSDGCAQLDAAVVIGNGGVIYGATETGGPSGSGRVFALIPPAAPGGAWTERTLYNFTGPDDGVYPVGLAIGSGGVIYGSANRGGAFGYGTVFSLTPPASPGGPWVETTLYSFKGGVDGNYPFSGVAVGSGGVLYGTTGYGGGFGWGNVFSLTPPVSAGGSWTEIPLYGFTGGTDGGVPSKVVIGPGGALYGTTYTGGTAGLGTVFGLTL